MTEGRREGGFGKTWRLQQLQVELSHVGVVTVSPTMTIVSFPHYVQSADKAA